MPLHVAPCSLSQLGEGSALGFRIDPNGVNRGLRISIIGTRKKEQRRCITAVASSLCKRIVRDEKWALVFRPLTRLLLFPWFTQIICLLSISVQYGRIFGGRMWIRLCFFLFGMDFLLLKLTFKLGRCCQLITSTAG